MWTGEQSICAIGLTQWCEALVLDSQCDGIYLFSLMYTISLYILSVSFFFCCQSFVLFLYRELVS